MDEMAQKDKLHFEEVNELKEEKEALYQETLMLRSMMAKLERRLGRVTVRKDQLKKGLSHMTDERDRFKSQKEALAVGWFETCFQFAQCLSPDRIERDTTGQRWLLEGSPES